jgi:hypothetical protein
VFAAMENRSSTGKNINWRLVHQEGMERFGDISKYHWRNRTPNQLKDRYWSVMKTAQQ